MSYFVGKNSPPPSASFFFFSKKAKSMMFPFKALSFQNNLAVQCTTVRKACVQQVTAKQLLGFNSEVLLRHRENSNMVKGA